MTFNNSLKVFTGNAHADLAADICNYLEIDVGKAEVLSSRTTILSFA